MGSIDLKEVPDNLQCSTEGPQSPDGRLLISSFPFSNSSLSVNAIFSINKIPYPSLCSKNPLCYRLLCLEVPLNCP